MCTPLSRCSGRRFQWVLRKARTSRATSCSRVISAFFFVVVVYGVFVLSITGSLSSVFDTAASPSTPLPRWFNFTDDVARMHPDDRRLIVLHATQGMDTSTIEETLARHPSVLYFGDVLKIQPEHLRFVEEQNSLTIVRDLFDCCSHTLSYFVDYANENLLSQNQPFWCGSNRRTKMLVDLEAGGKGSDRTRDRHPNYSNCKTVRKSAVRSFCQRRHVAVKSQDRSWIDALAKTHGNHIRLIHLIPNESNITDVRKTDASHETFVDSSLEHLYARDFFIGHFHPKLKTAALLELYNFLDLYLDQNLL